MGRAAAAAAATWVQALEAVVAVVVVVAGVGVGVGVWTSRRRWCGFSSRICQVRRVVVVEMAGLAIHGERSEDTKSFKCPRPGGGRP